MSGTLRWAGEEDDAQAARRAAAEREELLAGVTGEPITVANEFAEIRVARVRTRNGVRLLVESPRSGQWVALCPLELEALTWQNTATFSSMIGNPFAPLIREASPEGAAAPTRESPDFEESGRTSARTRPRGRPGSDERVAGTSPDSGTGSGELDMSTRPDGRKTLDSSTRKAGTA
ncbi:hypothetical protein [Rhizohabitans arisaemae]|uniref:hypothetical protein n=1 Tax=Rhizohabitans arisaemae TaxID=2720610 RepID=UPI0024B04683|nr:hypothetical protein [Rhizohabitans arisaemae]